MKSISLLFLAAWLSGLAALCGCASHTTEATEHFTVHHIQGDSQYSLDDKIWHPLVSNAVYSTGIIIHTSTNSRVDLTFAEKPERDPVSPPPGPAPKRLRVFENTFLKIDRAEQETQWHWKHWEGTKYKDQFKMRLYTGTILGSTTSPAVNPIYQINFTNGAVALSPHAIYRINASGMLYILHGAASVLLADENRTLQMSHHQVYDPAASVVRPMTETEVAALSRVEVPFEIGFDVDTFPVPTRPRPGMLGALRKF